MTITLQQVSNEIFSENRMRVIKYIFSKGKHENVLILGYSCSDVFDILPQIETMRQNLSNVFFIEHNEHKQLIKDIAVKRHKNPFLHFEWSKWVLHSTDELVKTLWEFFLAADDYLFLESSGDDRLWEKCVDNWFLEIEENYLGLAKFQITGNIFFQISKYEKAISYYNQILSLAKEINDKRNIAVALSSIGNCYYRLSDYQMAMEFFK